MKLLYFLMGIFALSIGGYFVVNNFHYDSIKFSGFLIESLFIMLMGGLFVGIGIFFINQRKKQNVKGMMTIRQYYDYKSAR